jgi:hypothetical protein
MVVILSVFRLKIYQNKVFLFFKNYFYINTSIQSKNIKKINLKKNQNLREYGLHRIPKHDLNRILKSKIFIS